MKGCLDSYRQRQISQSDCEITSNCGKKYYFFACVKLASHLSIKVALVETIFDTILRFYFHVKKNLNSKCSNCFPLRIHAAMQPSPESVFIALV